MRSTYTSGGNKITIETFAPQDGRKHPIVCALHGSGGLHVDVHLQFAEMISQQGFFVCVPHYFEATGTYWANEATIWREFPTWMQTISDGLDYVSQNPAADANRIAMVGFSLGAYLSLSLGSQQRRIKAIVDFFGGMPDHFGDKLEHIAPVLILHGESDNVVPVAEAHKLSSLLKSRNIQHEMKLYRSAGHGFRGFDMLDAGQRTFHFLKQHLAAESRVA